MLYEHIPVMNGKIFLVLSPFLPGSGSVLFFARIRFKDRSGSVTNVFQILDPYQMIRICNSASPPPLSSAEMNFQMLEFVT